MDLHVVVLWYVIYIVNPRFVLIIERDTSSVKGCAKHLWKLRTMVITAWASRSRENVLWLITSLRLLHTGKMCHLRLRMVHFLLHILEVLYLQYIAEFLFVVTDICITYKNFSLLRYKIETQILELK